MCSNEDWMQCTSANTEYLRIRIFLYDTPLLFVNNCCSTEIDSIARKTDLLLYTLLSFMTFSALVLAILWSFTHRMHVEDSYFTGIKTLNIYVRFNVSCKEKRSSFLLNSTLYTHEFFFKSTFLVTSIPFFALRNDCCYIVSPVF